MPWSSRRRHTLIGLTAGTLLFGLAALALPDEFGATSAVLAALCAFLLVAAFVVFVAVLLLLSTDAALRWLWILIALAAAGWTASAVWRTRRTED